MNPKLLKYAAILVAVALSGGAGAAPRWMGHGEVGALHIGGFHPMNAHPPRTFAPSRPAMNLAPRAARTPIAPVRSSARAALAVPGAFGSGSAPAVPVTVPNLNNCPGFMAPNCNPMQCVCSITSQ